jgi:hypothetical protein
MGNTGPLYQGESAASATHLALNWRGRLRYVVPRDHRAQRAAWNLFHPGRTRIVFEAMTLMPRLLGAAHCVESAALVTIRGAMGSQANLSCCNAGAGGVWSKYTVLLLDEQTIEPLCFVKAGAGAAIGSLLRNEAGWLSSLRDEPSLAGHIPALIAHRPADGSGQDLDFLAQSPLRGSSSSVLGQPHFDFLEKLQAYSSRALRYQDSLLYRTLHARISDLAGLLPAVWSERIAKAMKRIESSLATSSTLFVAAHNDFTPWNIRLVNGRACIFDWEFAAHEQLPLFDPLHFAMSPLALEGKPLDEIIRAMSDTVRLCQQSLGEERCRQPEIQTLAYALNLCTLYQWADRGTRNAHPSLVSYAGIIDSILSA